MAIKRMKTIFRSIDQVNALPEIQALKRLNDHPNIIKLIEVLYDRQTGRLALVFELMTCNLYEMIKGRKQYLPEAKVKSYIYQVLRALDFMHRNGIFHRDIKPENVLVVDELAKIADLGSCRGIYTKQPYSEYIATRWYRSPECLITDGYYSYKMDIWAVGCIFFEVLMLYPLFPGKDELDQIHRIHSLLGTPSKQLLSKFRPSKHISFDFPQMKGRGLRSLMKNCPADLMDLLNGMLTYDPDERFSARDCLRHPYFRDLRNADKRQRMDTPASRSSAFAALLPGTSASISSASLSIPPSVVSTPPQGMDDMANASQHERVKARGKERERRIDLKELLEKDRDGGKANEDKKEVEMSEKANNGKELRKRKAKHVDEEADVHLLNEVSIDSTVGNESVTLKDESENEKEMEMKLERERQKEREKEKEKEKMKERQRERQKIKEKEMTMRKQGQNQLPSLMISNQTLHQAKSQQHSISPLDSPSNGSLLVLPSVTSHTNTHALSPSPSVLLASNSLTSTVLSPLPSKLSSPSSISTLPSSASPDPSEMVNSLISSKTVLPVLLSHPLRTSSLFASPSPKPAQHLPSLKQLASPYALPQPPSLSLPPAQPTSVSPASLLQTSTMLSSPSHAKAPSRVGYAQCLPSLTLQHSTNSSYLSSSPSPSLASQLQAHQIQLPSVCM